MASRTHFLTLALPLFTALVSADTAPRNNTSSNSACTVEDLYLRPNASNSYTIPAIVQPLNQPAESLSNTILSSDTETWQIISALSQATDPCNTLPNNQDLEQLLLLDTSRSQPNASAIPPALAACSFVFELPQSDIGKSDNGTCASLIGQDCVNDIHSAAQTLAEAAALTNSASQGDACTAIGNGLTTLPASCTKQKSNIETTFAILEAGDIDLTYNATTECSSGPKSVPIPIYDQITEVQEGNTTVYDQWARTTRPVLLTFFSNGTIFHGSPFADTRLLCTTPKNIAIGSHNPTSAADHSTGVDAKSMVAMFLVLNTLLFFVL